MCYFPCSSRHAEVEGWLHTDPCLPTYAGVAPLTEPEVRAVARFLGWPRRARPRFSLYLSLHSYSQLWMAPWGYTMEPPPHYDRLVRVACLWQGWRVLRVKLGMGTSGSMG